MMTDHLLFSPPAPVPRRGEHVLRGFFWVTTKGCDFVMVTNQGLEMYSVKVSGPHEVWTVVCF